MSIRISSCSTLTFSKDNLPKCHVPSGATIEIETLDCFSNQLQRPGDTLETMDWERVNPATGPIYVENAQPGDILKVTVRDIKLADQGVMAAGKGLGILGDLLEGLESKIIPIREDKAIFDSSLEIPLNPMIGVIGVAPEEEHISCGTPGCHGGNMDNLMVTTGAVLYLPVFVEGALFALGDLHAAMGDGEIGVTGVETAGTVTVTLEVIRGTALSNPVLENVNYFTTIASDENLEAAVKRATEDMARILKDKLPLSMSELAMLMSITGHTQICQVVDPLRTARFVMPKWVLEKYKFSFV